MGPWMTTISLRIPESLHRRLVRTAKRTERSKSDVVREALQLYLRELVPPARGSLYELARHVLGKFEGPEDTSDKRNLENFGQGSSARPGSANRSKR